MLKKLSKQEAVELCSTSEYNWNFQYDPLYTTSPLTTYSAYKAENIRNADSSLCSDLFYHESWDSYPNLNKSFVTNSGSKEYVMLLPQNFRIGIFPVGSRFPFVKRNGFESLQDFHNELKAIVGETKNYQQLSNRIKSIRVSPTAFSSNKIDVYLVKALKIEQQDSLTLVMRLLDPVKNRVTLMTDASSIGQIPTNVTWWTDSPFILLKSSLYNELKSIFM